MQMLIKVSGVQVAEERTFLNQRRRRVLAFPTVPIQSPARKVLFSMVIFYVFFKDY